MNFRYGSAVAAICAALVLSSCGGSSSPAAVAPVTTISGSAIKGPVNGATVTIKDASTGATLATTTTNASGAYSVDVQFSGDVLVEVTGGTYTDEATGAATTLTTPMRVIVTASGGAVTGVVTPLTTMAFTNAFGSSTSGFTASAFNTQASSLALQFQLGSTNLATTLPVVTGTVNDYGRILRGISQYLQTQNVTLQSLINTAFDSTTLAAFSTTFTSAYNLANPGSAITFTFTSNGFNIGGTGAGGGSGTCGINVSGQATVNGFTVPLNLNYCVNGIAAGSCSSGNSSLSQALSGQSGVAGAVNLNYTYASSCASNAITITLQ